MHPVVFWLLCILLPDIVTPNKLNNASAPTAVFHTRPEIHAPIITFDILKPDLVSPEYIFLAPYRNTDEGPYIYDNWGNLVWSGAAEWGPITAHAPQVCRYRGSDHVCFFRGHQHQGFARGHGVIMDSNYRIVKTIESSGSAAMSDMHEFRVVNDGHQALMTVYQTRQYDLTAFGVASGIGWIVDGTFQEVDVESGKLLFEWRSLDHEVTSPLYSYVGPSSTDTSGTGLTAAAPWDYFHINSIDKNQNGDYLVSARHMSAVYKISGTDGSVAWALNGARSSFALEDFGFSHQHDARWISENETHTVLSIFDNAALVNNRTHPESRGMVISINHDTDIARLVEEYKAPEKNGISSASQGNMQRLPSSNVMIGWGEHAYFSEHLHNGEAVSFGKVAFWGSDVMMYRCHKFPWRGEPLTNPKLWTYSRTGNSLTTQPPLESRSLEDGMTFHVSWNGATEVRSWAFYVSATPRGPWARVATVVKTGFETSYHLPIGVWTWAYAEALDGTNQPIRKSTVTRTFVPSPQLAQNACDEYACQLIPPPSEGQPQVKPKQPAELLADENQAGAVMVMSSVTELAEMFGNRDNLEGAMLLPTIDQRPVGSLMSKLPPQMDHSWIDYSDIEKAQATNLLENSMPEMMSSTFRHLNRSHALLIGVLIVVVLVMALTKRKYWWYRNWNRLLGRLSPRQDGTLPWAKE